MEYTAIVRFLDKNEGGRHTPPNSGFRPQLKVGDEYTSCIVRAKSAMSETMDFGVDHTVTIEPVFHEVYKDRISMEMKVELYEGSKLIGSGYFCRI